MLPVTRGKYHKYHQFFPIIPLVQYTSDDVIFKINRSHGFYVWCMLFCMGVLLSTVSSLTHHDITDPQWELRTCTNFLPPKHTLSFVASGTLENLIYLWA